MVVVVRRNDLVEDREVTAFDGVDEAANQGLVHFDRCRHRSSLGRRRTPLARGLSDQCLGIYNIAYYRFFESSRDGADTAMDVGRIYFNAARTSSAVGVSLNHFWSTSSARTWASSLSAWQASETTIVRYCRSDAARAVDSTATSVAIPTSTRVSTPATRRMVSSAVPSNPLAACPLTTGSPGRGAMLSMTSTAGVPRSRVGLSMSE